MINQYLPLTDFSLWYDIIPTMIFAVQASLMLSLPASSHGKKNMIWKPCFSTVRFLLLHFFIFSVTDRHLYYWHCLRKQISYLPFFLFIYLFIEFVFCVWSIENVSDVTTETAAAYYAAISTLVTSKERNLLYPVKVAYTGEGTYCAFLLYFTLQQSWFVLSFVQFVAVIWCWNAMNRQ